MFFCSSLVSPWFDKPKEDIKVSMEMGDKVSFKCGAKGFPLEVEWRLETHRKSSIQPFSCISKGDNYENQNPLRHRLVRRRLVVDESIFCLISTFLAESVPRLIA